MGAVIGYARVDVSRLDSSLCDGNWGVGDLSSTTPKPMNDSTNRVVPRVLCEEFLNEHLPAWKLIEADGILWMKRTYATPSWAMTLHAANVIGFLSEVGWHHPRLILDYRRLQVELHSHDAGGITQRDFELATRIEEVLTWHPQATDALTGHRRRKLT